MKVEIMILNLMKYEKDGVEKSRMGYIFTSKDTMANSDKFKGYSDQSVFFEDKRAIDRIPIEFIGKKSIGYVKDEPNPRNPLQPRKIFCSIECDGKTIDLL